MQHQYSNFTDEQTEAEEGKRNIQKVKQLVSGRAKNNYCWFMITIYSINEKMDNLQDERIKCSLFSDH